MTTACLEFSTASLTVIANSPSTAVPATPSRTPLTGFITMEDPGQSIEASLTTLVAANAFAEAAVILEPSVYEHRRPARVTTPPKDNVFTSEDGGQSEGASATSLRAAQILANLFTDDIEQKVVSPKETQGTYRPCDTGPSYCC